jgi:hypothetical protein
MKELIGFYFIDGRPVKVINRGEEGIGIRQYNFDKKEFVIGYYLSEIVGGGHDYEVEKVSEEILNQRLIDITARKNS